MVWRELIDAVVQHVPQAAWPEVRADIRTNLERIERCQALDPEDVKNVSRDRDLFEVRLQLETWSLLIRIYETEPPAMPHHIIALRSHRKVVNVHSDEIARLQNDEIDIASRRLTAERVNQWGVP